MALELRKAGETYDAIAAHLGMSKNAVWKSVQRALADITREPAESVRRLERARLDTLQARLWSRARRGDVAAIDRVVKIMERRARLLGLDSPISVKIDDVVAEILDVVASVCGPEKRAEVLEAIARLDGAEAPRPAPTATVEPVH